MATAQTGGFLQRLRRAALRQDGGGLADGELLERYIRYREEAAFEALVRRHGPTVWRVCRRTLANEADAEDAFQATFLVLARKAASVVPRSMVGNWLYGVAQRTALCSRTMNTKRRAKEKQAAEKQRPAAPREDPRELQALLDAELNRLPAGYRAAIILCELEGKTRKEAARQLGWPEGTVAGRLARARALLAKRLARRGLTLPGGALAAVLFPGPASASMPQPLVASTLKAAAALAAGVLPARVAALTEGVIKAMLLNKLKTATAILMLLTLGLALALSGGLAAGQGAAPSAPAAGAPGASGRDAGKAPAPRKRQARTVSTDAAVDAVAWSPDGNLLAAQVRIWLDTGGKPEITGHELQLRDGRTGEVTRTLAKAANPGIRGAAFSPDGKSVAAIESRVVGGQDTENEVKLWDVKSGKVTATLKGAQATWLHNLAFSRDGKLLAAVGSVQDAQGKNVGGEVNVWDVPSGKLLWQNQDHSRQLNGVAISPDGKLVASAGFDRAIKLWDTKTGDLKRTLEGHEEYGVFSLAFSRGGKLLASGGLDGTVRLWDPATGEQKRTLTTAFSKGLIVSVAFSPDGKTLAASGTPTKPDASRVMLWDVETGKLRHSFKDHIERPMSLAFAPDGSAVAVGSWQKQLFLLPVGK
jgi:RNA polymerase sigma factor (sigma-70 family)